MKPKKPRNPARGATAEITALLRKLEAEEGCEFNEFRNGIVMKGSVKTTGKRHSEIWYGVHEVDERMLELRPR